MGITGCGGNKATNPIAKEMVEGKFFLCEQSQNGPLSIYVLDNENWIKVVWIRPGSQEARQLDKFDAKISDDEVLFGSRDASIGIKNDQIIRGEATGKIDKFNNLTLTVGSKKYYYPNLREATKMEVEEAFAKYKNL